eukprot:363248-Chlamydomonas_euryale.AAC.5
MHTYDPFLTLQLRPLPSLILSTTTGLIDSRPASPLQPVPSGLPPRPLSQPRLCSPFHLAWRPGPYPSLSVAPIPAFPRPFLPLLYPTSRYPTRVTPRVGEQPRRQSARCAGWSTFDHTTAAAPIYRCVPPVACPDSGVRPPHLEAPHSVRHAVLASVPQHEAYRSVRRTAPGGVPHREATRGGMVLPCKAHRS